MSPLQMYRREVKALEIVASIGWRLASLRTRLGRAVEPGVLTTWPSDQVQVTGVLQFCSCGMVSLAHGRPARVISPIPVPSALSLSQL